ncbi:hypothetical protein XENORESO_014129 [Xenotaenia resolanae]|uniref:Uncharacterized protein n=1 Tax=Xenotaenia resolanae TaxID=208358 RepID=A0ABV0W6D6_9TELE
MGQSQQSAQSPVPGMGPQPQPGKRGNKAHPTPTPRPPTRNTRPKMAGLPKCKLQASKGTCTPIDKRTETPGVSQAVKQTPRCTTPPTTVPKGKTPSKQNGGTERPQHAQQRGRTPA